MRIPLILAVVIIPAVAQSPVVQLTNATRPGSKDFQVGDRFEIAIAGAANQPVSVRTTMQGRTDWGPVIGSTDMSGRWSTTGQFQKSDFGHWDEVWTVGGKLASPAVRFSVGTACLTGGQGFVFMSGPNVVGSCDTAEGHQAFQTPSLTDPLRTPDGRLLPGRIQSNMTQEQYRAEIMGHFVTSGKDIGAACLGDEAGDLIMRMIGVNALTEDETRNVLLIIRAAYGKPDCIPQAAREPSGTLLLLRHLADLTVQEGLKQHIAETMAWVQLQ